MQQIHKEKNTTPKGVIYKILPENSSDWDNATSIQDNEGTGENVVFTGLTPGTTYLVKAEMASIASNIISVKTETELQIPNHNMEDWHYVTPDMHQNIGRYTMPAQRIQNLFGIH